eukprot:g65475.t1
MILAIKTGRSTETTECTTDGKWKIQDFAETDEIYTSVRDKWKEACELHGFKKVLHKPPHPKTIRRVWWKDFENVVHIRDGDFSKCEICTQLAAQHGRGFDSDLAARQCELWSPETTAAWKLYLEWDGAGDNTAATMLAFLTHVVDKGWRFQIETHRSPTKHRHGDDDQNFRRTTKQQNGLPTAEQKTWGDPQAAWMGVNDDVKGDPIQVTVRRPETDFSQRLPIPA